MLFDTISTSIYADAIIMISTADATITTTANTTSTITSTNNVTATAKFVQSILIYV